MEIELSKSDTVILKDVVSMLRAQNALKILELRLKYGSSMSDKDRKSLEDIEDWVYE